MTNRIKPHWILGPDGKWQATGPQPTEIDALMAKVHDAVQHVFATVKPILRAGGAAKPQDRIALRETVLKLTLENTHFLSRDEMHVVLSIVLADTIMSDIESRPWGGDKPDLLSGV